MHINHSLNDRLDHLRCFLPPIGLLHVGAGNGSTVVRYVDWAVPTAALVEAEVGYHDKLAAVIQGRSEWAIHTALVSDREGECDFYVASNPHESSILQPESLAGIWRNLKTHEQRRLPATTLEALLSALNYPPELLNWVVIDCFPALPIIRGAGKYLDEWDVIIARVILDEAQLPGIGATKLEVDTFLFSCGFRCIACEQERQPTVGKALYVRDWKASQRASLAQAEQKVRLGAAEFAERTARLQLAKDEQAQLAAQRQYQVDQLANARDLLKSELKRQLAELEKQARSESDLRQELLEVRQTAALSIKLQALREADLRDLQARYQETLLSQNSQHQLLVKLSERLNKASSYFHRLASNGGVTLPGASEEVDQKRIPVRKVSGKAARKGG